MQSSASLRSAVEACEALCFAYDEYADRGEANALAALYVPDGVFDRMGQTFIGRDAIRQVIAGRPVGLWTRHCSDNIRIELDADGLAANGCSDLQMQRGWKDREQVEHIRARFTDRFVLTDDGWRFSRRKVEVLSTETT